MSRGHERADRLGYELIRRRGVWVCGSVCVCVITVMSGMSSMFSVPGSDSDSEINSEQVRSFIQ